MGNFVEVSGARKRAFLNRFAELGRIDKAAELSGCTPMAHYHWLKEDTEYVAAFAEAKQMVADRLEAEAVRRAYEGIEKPIFYRGKVVHRVQEYSDSLLMFLLKGAKPGTYRDNLDITSGGKELRITIGNSDAI